jgi:CxxC motif-containing protein (DUF1111 family)
MTRPRSLLSALALLLSLACGGAKQGAPEAGPTEDAGAGDGGAPAPPSDAVDQPLAAATDAQLAVFHRGDALFDHDFTSVDGLGPLYIRQSCGSCHALAGKGPGLVQKMAVVGADGTTPLADQGALPYGHTVRPYVAATGRTPILPPTSGLPDGGQLKLTVRIGPALWGRGYLEAIDDASILAQQAAQAQRSDGIRGRVNRVAYHSQPNPDTRYHQHQPGEANLVGRFGLKARNATLDDFAADAFQGDMGITSPLRPSELPNPDGAADDDLPGVDVDAGTVNDAAEYMRLLAIPERASPDPRGLQLFSQARCDVCHAPSLRTRADYPVPQLAGVDAPLYTDVLLHDLGPELADGLTDESALSGEWRTAPLVGVRLQRNYLHDGRAATVEQAIRLHGGQAAGARDAFAALSDEDRAALLAFVRGL